METSVLYVLFFPELLAIKIGSSEIPYERARTLKNAWGEIELEESLFVKEEKCFVKFLEKELHRTFCYAVQDFEKKDGSTEFFNYSIFEEVKTQIRHILEENNKKSVIKKGIRIPKRSRTF